MLPHMIELVARRDIAKRPATGQFTRMLSWFRNRKSLAPQTPQAIPTVKFDPKRVSKAVKEDLRRNIDELRALPSGSHNAAFKAALASIKAGRDLKSLTDVLVKIGVEWKEAASIAMNLNNRATSIMNSERAANLGITEAIWLYSGAPCVEYHPRTAEDEFRDAQHKAANGAKFPLAEGLFIGDRRVFPGCEPGCKCTSKSVLPF